VSGYDDNNRRALDRLEDLLDAYADARLMPRGPVLSRIRANVLAEAAAVSAASVRRPQLAEPRRAPRWAVASPFTRRAIAFGFAAMLTIGTSAAVFAAPPGSPFYNARVYIETLTLPTQVDARLEGHERLLEERIAEAEAAAARNDAPGLAAALAAYQAEVDAASADIGDDAARLAHLESELAKHTTALSALATTLPDESSIERAIDKSSTAIAKLKAKGSPPHPTHAPGEPQGQQQGQQR
jgi:Domain of unknown function (DUF5667)